MSRRAGSYAKAYYNTGSYATPSWTEIKLGRDVTLTDEVAEIDTTVREETFRSFTQSLADLSFEMDVVIDRSEESYRHLARAAAHGDTVDLLILTGPNTAANQEGLRFEAQLFQRTINQPMEDVQTTPLKARPVKSDNGDPVRIATGAKQTGSGTAIAADTDVYLDGSGYITDTDTGSLEYLGKSVWAAGDSDSIVFYNYGATEDA